MGKKKKNRIQTEIPEPLSFCPFEGLLPSPEEEQGGDPEISKPSRSSGMNPPGREDPAEGSGDSLKLKGAFSLRKEKKGRGGKTVTLVSGNCLSREDAERLSKILRKALGCGSRTEGEMVLLQGDLRERAELWLLSHGAKRVVVG